MLNLFYEDEIHYLNMLESKICYFYYTNFFYSFKFRICKTLFMTFIKILI